MSLCRANICKKIGGDKWLHTMASPPLNTLVTLVIVVLVSCLAQTQSASSEPLVFTNQFLVRLHGTPSKEAVHRVAKRHGFVNLGPVSCSRYCHI